LLAPVTTIVNVRKVNWLILVIVLMKFLVKLEMFTITPWLMKLATIMEKASCEVVSPPSTVLAY
jgi:hypothetical protein